MRAVRICAIALVVAISITGAAAAATANTISITVPPLVTHKIVYDLTIQGFSRKRAVAYLFVDYAGCARSFTAEHKRATNESDFYSVRGRFTEVSGWKSSSTGTDHACAYLVGRKSGKLLAKTHVTFQIH